MSEKKNLDFDYIRELVKLLKDTGLNEIEVSEGDSSVRLRLGTENTTIMQAPMAVAPAAAVAPITANAPTAPAGPNPDQCLTAPMVGTFYRAPSPDASPFASEGDKVEKGQVICVIEAMKTFNQIEADRDGVIKSVLLDDATPVEFGQPLFELE